LTNREEPGTAEVLGTHPKANPAEVPLHQYTQHGQQTGGVASHRAARKP